MARAHTSSDTEHRQRDYCVQRLEEHIVTHDVLIVGIHAYIDAISAIDKVKHREPAKDRSMP